MNTLQHSTRWLGLALACGIITFAVSVEAKKPPKPPPEPPGPAYQVIGLEGELDLFPDAISDSGILAGTMIDGANPTSLIAGFSLPPQMVAGEVQYLVEDVQRLEIEDGDDTWSEAEALDVNEAGIAVGWAWNGYGFGNRAMLWLADGTPIDLGVASPDTHSQATAINAFGLVAVGEAGKSTAGVIVPLDLDEDGEPDLWFTDLDGNGINDLLYPIAVDSSFTPVAINEVGQVAFGEGYLLTPDFSDADGDGNPWFADTNSDAVNDLMVVLTAPAAGVAVNDLNNLGQVVGHSGGHVVRWEFIEGVEIVTDLGTLSRNLSMFPKGMNDSGQIVGTSAKTRRPGQSGPSWLIDNDAICELSIRPADINNDGWICGSGFVAIPVDEP